MCFNIEEILICALCEVQIWDQTLNILGKRLEIMIFAIFFIFVSQIAFALTPDSFHPICPILYLVIIGLGYSVYMTIYWTCIPYIVKNKVVGSAFGINFAAINIGCFIFPIVNGVILDNTNRLGGYFWVNIFYYLN